MFIGSIEIELRASWVNSLKEKRMIIKSLIERLKNRFNISVCEIDKQDVHKSIVIGVATISTNKKDLDGILENIIRYIEENEEAMVVEVFKEVL